MGDGAWGLHWTLEQFAWLRNEAGRVDGKWKRNNTIAALLPLGGHFGNRAQMYCCIRGGEEERYWFCQRDQRPSESISVFVVELKKIAATCIFGTFLKEAIRDHLTVGVHNDAIRYKVVVTEENDLTFEKAYVQRWEWKYSARTGKINQ
ncbi:hypothetical protein MRX96_046036 [Rhipicephalus microplus]